MFFQHFGTLKQMCKKLFEHVTKCLKAFLSAPTRSTCKGEVHNFVAGTHAPNMQRGGASHSGLHPRTDMQGGGSWHSGLHPRTPRRSPRPSLRLHLIWNVWQSSRNLLLRRLSARHHAPSTLAQARLPCNATPVVRFAS